MYYAVTECLEHLNIIHYYIHAVPYTLFVKEKTRINYLTKTIIFIILNFVNQLL